MLVIESLSVLIGFLPLTLGYLKPNGLGLSLTCALVGSFWLVSVWIKRSWMALPGLIVLTFMAGLGVWDGLNPFLMACSILGSLVAWDMGAFRHRLQNAAPEDDLRKLIRRHTWRLTWFGTVSLVMILFGLFVKFRISFGWIYLLTFLGIISLTQLVGYLRGGS